MGCKETTLMDGDKAYHVEDEYEDEGSVKETHFQGFTIKELDRRKAEARLGYLSMNLYHPPDAATWGRYNDRKINDAWVRELVNDFKRQLGNCTENDSIDVAIKPEWLKNSADVVKVIDGLSIGEVPVMEFNEDGLKAIKEYKIIMLGGNHRRAAVCMYVEGLESQML